MRPKDLKPAAEIARNKPHGTRVKYIGGCKCMLCRAANSNYETKRAAARKLGDWNGIVDARKAKRHLKILSRAGVGSRAVSAACDVPRSVLSGINNGRRTRIRARTERAILSTTADAISDSALVDADKVWRQIIHLIEEGFTKTELASRLGVKKIQFRQFEVTAKTAMLIDRFYRKIMAEADK